ncbi:nitroreductase family protein [Tianweitania sp. BSSL-BM11]|uniref:Nitroreductase family protein n=1 Tax=Tianweitania aestuarii TaxID=2814886 RepID=A0ABS5RXM1_9HYPH|nr:nitroreductase family protein [Tianweitania aestuarii]MBS9721808.1 nitroreductase family protein [Tianweitania aestuarii]
MEIQNDQQTLSANDTQTILSRLASRLSCRDFDGSRIAREELLLMLSDALEAPSSCNQQHWHFIIVDDPQQLARAAELAGGNPHFRTCSALVYLCFQKGWTHDNFSVVQGVAAAGYHLMLSAHLRGYHAIWNAGIGDPEGVRAMLDLPSVFDCQGAIALGRAHPDAPARKPPRRPLNSVVSFQTFERPENTIYPVENANTYPFHAVSRDSNPYAQWDPTQWSWAQLADYRAWSVWAKSPLNGVYTSRRQGEASERELDLIPSLPTEAKVAELMPWGGTSTVTLARRLPLDASLTVVELHENNLHFIQDRLPREGITHSVEGALFSGTSLPFATQSVDLVVIAQSLEHMADPAAILREVRRVLRNEGHLVLSVRNRASRYGAEWARSEARGQVPLQGPFTPIGPKRLQQLLCANFEVEELHGIGQSAGGDSEVLKEGLDRFRRRIIALRASPA